MEKRIISLFIIFDLKRVHLYYLVACVHHSGSVRYKNFLDITSDIVIFEASDYFREQIETFGQNGVLRKK